MNSSRSITEGYNSTEVFMKKVILELNSEGFIGLDWSKLKRQPGRKQDMGKVVMNFIDSFQNFIIAFENSIYLYTLSSQFVLPFISYLFTSTIPTSGRWDFLNWYWRPTITWPTWAKDKKASTLVVGCSSWSSASAVNSPFSLSLSFNSLLFLTLSEKT